jgi:CBS domain-containing protein
MEKTAAQVMTRVLHTVSPTTSTDQAMTVMTNSRVRHLPVLEHDELVGLISIGDVVKARLEEQAQEVDSLTAYVAGSV